MNNDNKISLTAKVSGIALVLFQLMSNTASADYRGYWIDAVQRYQNQAYQEYAPYHEQYSGYSDYQYHPAPAPAQRPRETGRASYYADKYQGRSTASGEPYNMHDMTAAHPSLPFGTPIRVTNLENGRSVVVRVNDRGPFKPGRVVDVSLVAAQQLGLILNGTATVQIDVLG